MTLRASIARLQAFLGAASTEPPCATCGAPAPPERTVSIGRHTCPTCQRPTDQRGRALCTARTITVIEHDDIPPPEDA